MPALLVSAALATGQPTIQTVRTADAAAWARISTVQNLSGVVSGAAPFAQSSTAAQVAAGGSTGSVMVRQSDAGIVSTSIDTGVNSVTLAATVVSARIVLNRP